MTLLLPVTVAAQTVTVPVRGGEHTDYTRLVIPLPEGISWTFSQTGRDGTLSVAGGIMRFDTTQTFSRIPRTRLAELRDTGNGLALKLACDCAIRASEDLAQMLVLDIRSSTTPRLDPAVRPRPRPDTVLAISDAAQRAGAAAARALRGQTGEDDLQIRLPAAAVLTAPPVITPPAVVADTSPTPNAILTAMTGAIANAVGQGLLAPLAPPTTIDTAPLADNVSLPPGIPLDNHVLVTDSISQARGALGQSPPKTAPEQCPDTGLISLENPTAPPDRASILAELFDEQGRPVPEMLRAAAKQAIRTAMGAEARLFLSVIPTPTWQDDILQQLTYLIDLEPAPEPERVAALANCRPFGALWTVLAVLPKPVTDDDLIAQAIRDLASLPRDLRMHLGPHLLRHLVGQDHQRHAHALRDLLDRALAPAAPLHSVSPGQANAATAQTMLGADLTKLAAADDPLETLQMLRHANGRALVTSSQLLDHARQQVFLLRGSDLATALGQEIVQALAIAGEFEQALEVLTLPDIALQTPQREALRSDLLSQIAARAPDELFLTLVFAQNPWRAPLTTPAAALVADRLYQLGFVEAAERLRAEHAIDGARQSEQPVASPVTLASVARAENSGANMQVAPERGATTSADDPPTERPDARALRATAPLDQDRTANAPTSGIAPSLLAPPNSGNDTPPDATSATPSGEAAISTAPLTQPETAFNTSEGATRGSSELGLLGQGRTTLEQSAALRDRLLSLLDN